MATMGRIVNKIWLDPNKIGEIYLELEKSYKACGQERTEMPLVVVWPGQRNRDHGSEESLSAPEHRDISGVGNEGGGGAVTPAAQETLRTLNTGHQLSQAIVSPFTQIAHSQRYYYYKQSLFARRARDPRPVQRQALQCRQTER